MLEELSPGFIRDEITSGELQMLQRDLLINHVCKHAVLQLPCIPKVDAFNLRHYGEDLFRDEITSGELQMLQRDLLINHVCKHAVLQLPCIPKVDAFNLRHYGEDLF